MTGHSPPPGWYGFASRPGWLRWWDGAGWTDHWHPLTPYEPRFAPGRAGQGDIGPGFGLAMLGLFVGGQFVVGFVGAVVAAMASVDLDGDLLLVAGLVGQAVAAVAIVWLLRVRKPGVAFAGPGRFQVGPVVVGVVTGIVAPFVIGLLVQVAATLLELEQVEPVGLLSELAGLGPVGLVVFVVTAVVGAPVLEELVFRRGLYAGLRPKLGLVGALLASSVLFGLMHIDVLLAGGVGLLQGVALVVLGMILAGLYEWTRHLAAPVAAHAVFNTVAIAATLAAG